MSLPQDEESPQGREANYPIFRLLAIGAPKCGKTNLLKRLAERFGEWRKSTSTARLRSQVGYSIREIASHEVFSVLAERHFLLDGVIFFCDLSQPIRPETLAHLRFMVKTQTPLRMIIATHRDDFGDDQELLDDCEISMRESLSSVEAATDHVPIVYTDLDDDCEQEVLDRLNAIHWGPPLTERPILLTLSKSISVTRSESNLWVRLLRGTARNGVALESISWGRHQQRGEILFCAQNSIEQPILRAPCTGELRVKWIQPGAGTLLTLPGHIAISVRAKAQLYLYTNGLGSESMLPGWSQLRFLVVSEGFWREDVSVIFATNSGFFSSDKPHEVSIALDPDSPNFFFIGQHFEWSYLRYKGGGIITSL